MKNRNKAILVASLIGAVNSYATCSVPSNGATAGSTVTCTGTTTGVYSINAANVTFLNQGDMVGSGSQTGIIISESTTTSGINATNQGTMTWNNALPNGIGLRSTVMLGYYTNNNLTSATFTNDTAGQIFVNGTVNLPNGYATGGISVGARYGTAILDNKGSVTSTSTSTNGLGYAEGLAASGKMHKLQIAEVL